MSPHIPWAVVPQMQKIPGGFAFLGSPSATLGDPKHFSWKCFQALQRGSNTSGLHKRWRNPSRGWGARACWPLWCAFDALSKSGNSYQMPVVPLFLHLFGYFKLVDVGFQGQGIHWWNLFDRTPSGDGWIALFSNSQKCALNFQRHKSHHHISE